MAKYKFRLETLRKLRATHRDEMQAKLAEAVQAEQMLQQEIERVRTEIDAQQAVRRAALQNPQADVNQLLEVQRYQSVLRAQESTMLGQTKLLAAEAERRRQTLAEANRGVRVLDNLEERQRQAHRQQQMLAEVKELDEVASRQAEGNQPWA